MAHIRAYEPQHERTIPTGCSVAERFRALAYHGGVLGLMSTIVFAALAGWLGWSVLSVLVLATTGIVSDLMIRAADEKPKPTQGTLVAQWVSWGLLCALFYAITHVASGS